MIIYNDDHTQAEHITIVKDFNKIESVDKDQKDLDWNTDALDGCWRFLNRIWKVFNKVLEKSKANVAGSDNLIKTTHVYLKKITESYEAIALNKAVALARELFNEIEGHLDTSSAGALRFAFESFVKAFSPITPYICHEMWDVMKKAKAIRDEDWVEIDEELALVDTVTIAVQVNGRLRGTFEIERNANNEALEAKALEVLEKSIKKDMCRKIIVVPNKIVSVVI